MKNQNDILRDGLRHTAGTVSSVRDSLRRASRQILVALGFLVVIVYFFPHPSVSHYKYEQGRPWNYAKLIAPFDVPIHPDSASVAGSLDSLNRVFVPVYARVAVNVDSIMRVATARMNAIGKEDPATAPANPARTSEFYRALGAELTRDYARGVLEDSLPESLGTTHRTKARLMKDKVLHTVPLTAFVPRRVMMQRIDSLARTYGATRQLQNSGLGALALPSVVCNVDESEKILANEKALVMIDRGVIQRGQAIIDKGAVISAQDYTNLRTYESILESQQNETRRSDMLMLCGQMLFVALVLAIFLCYLQLYEHREVWTDIRAVTFLLTAITLFFVLTAVASTTISGGVYLVPLSIVPILTLVFFGARCALWTGMTAAILCSGCTGMTLEYITLQFVAMTAAVFTLRDLTQRSQLLRASAVVALGYWLAYLAVQLMVNGSFADFSWREVVMLGINALLTSLAYVLMFGAEKAFGFVSNVTLVELTDTNSPLLRELSDVCPGTVQHSMAVNTLASDAARAIGANVLLTRAGALYHDIGKMANPIFFTENQHGVNPHDGLAPERSAQIIVGHVTDGVKRATQARLPQVIKDFILQHHGRGMAKYFYISACNAAPEGTTVDPAPYRYPGPNPQTREASVLMMADSVEAASRSLKDHSSASIQALVDKIVDGQIEQGLHNSSNLTFRDVSAIKKAFVKRLSTIYHSRVEYPDAKKPLAAEPKVPADGAPAQ